MADFESIIKNHVNEDGNIPSEAIVNLTKAINKAVGNEFVDKARYKAKLEEIDTLKAEKQTAEDNATTAERWKEKYDKLKGDFDNYKTEQTQRETKETKVKAFTELLKASSVNEKYIDKIIKLTNFDEMELDGDKFKNAEDITKSIKDEWADFITQTQTKGDDTANPPKGENTKTEPRTLAEAMREKYKGDN